MNSCLVTDVAKQVLDRCAVTNEQQRGERECDRITREDENFEITLDYEFLEDFEHHPPGKLKRFRSLIRSVFFDDIYSYRIICTAFLHRKAASGNASPAEERKFLVTGLSTDDLVQEEELVSYNPKSTSRCDQHWGPHNFDKDSHCLNIMVSEKCSHLFTSVGMEHIKYVTLP